MKKLALILLFVILTIPVLALTQNEYDLLIEGIDSLESQVDSQIELVKDDLGFQVGDYFSNLPGAVIDFTPGGPVTIGLVVILFLLVGLWRWGKASNLQKGLFIDLHGKSKAKRRSWLDKEVKSAKDLLDQEKNEFASEGVNLESERESLEKLENLFADIESRKKVIAHWIKSDVHDELKNSLSQISKHARVESRLIEKHSKGALSEFKIWLDSLEPAFLRKFHKAKDIPTDLRNSYQSLQKRDINLLVKDLHSLEELLTVEDLKDPKSTAKLISELVLRFERFHAATEDFNKEIKKFEGELKDLQGSGQKHFRLEERKDMIDSAKKHSSLLVELYNERLLLLRELDKLLPRVEQFVEDRKSEENIPDELKPLIARYNLYNYLEIRDALIELGQEEISLNAACIEQLTHLDNTFPDQLEVRFNQHPEQRAKLLELVVDVLIKLPEKTKVLEPIKLKLEQNVN